MMRRYAEYRVSGVEWLGEVPSHWDVFYTKRLFEKRKVVNDGMKCENRLALTMNGVVPRSLDDLDGLQSNDYEGYQIFEAGDLAFKLIDLQNIKTSRVGIVPERGIMSPAYIRLEPKGAFGKFGYWYFMALYWTQVFNALGGGVRQTLGPEDLLVLPFPLPPLPEQTAIAAFLDVQTAAIDGLIEQQRRLIALLREKRQAVISHAVTRGLNPNTPLKPSGIDWLGHVPEGWEVKRLRHVARLRTIKAETTNNPIALENIEGWTGRFIVTDTEFQGDGVAFSAGDILFGKLRPYLAKVAVAETNGEAVGDFHVLAPVEGIHSRFLQRHLLAPAVISVIDGSTYGSKMPRVGWDFMADLQLAIPPLEEQIAIADWLESTTAQFDTLTTTAEPAIALLQERRAALISAAVTGKIDVRDWAKGAAA